MANPSTHALPVLYGWSKKESSDGSQIACPGLHIATNAKEPSLHEHQNSSWACRSSTSIEALPGGGFAALIGAPQWQHADMLEAARNRGHAAALAQCYTQYGPDCFQSLRGGFAAVIADASTGTLVLAVDRMGRYPLYYADRSDSVFFGSTLEPLFEQGQSTLSLDETGLYNYVYFHMVPSPLSIYRGVTKLVPGTSLQSKGHEVKINRFWSPTFNNARAQTFSDAGKTLRATLRRSVERAMADESAVGAFLSGGLDSSTVAGLLAELSDGQAHAYAIGFSAQGYDEMPYARITARHFGIQLHEYYVTPDDIVEALPTIAASYDEPFGNSSALPAYFCAKLAAEDGVRRLLAGDGGDELFAGNERYAKQQAFDIYEKVPNILRKSIIEPLFRALPDEFPLVSKARSYIHQANTPLPDRLQSYNFLHRLQAADVFSEEILSIVDYDIPLRMQRERYLQPENASVLNRMLYLDWKFTLADNDLRKVNQMCTLAGVDVAYPMLDDALLDFSCTIPDNWKMPMGKLRHFYKEAMRGWLPDETINKTKHGFGLPFGVWMESHAPLQSLAYDSLLSLKNRGYFKPAFIDEAIRLHRAGHAAYYGELVWILMVLELWMQAHVSRG